jgi:hypothetical protein
MNSFNISLVMIAALGLGSAVAYFPDYAAAPSKAPRPERLPLPTLGQVPRPASRMTVEEAYASLEQQRTKFDARQATMSANEREYLVVVFAIFDAATIARVEAATLLGRGLSAVEHVAVLDQLTRFACSFDAPPVLRPFHKHLIDALARQEKFFSDWQREGTAFAFTTPEMMRENEDLQTASRAIRRACNDLLTLYRDEGEQNHNAFMAYCAALDAL